MKVLIKKFVRAASCYQYAHNVFLILPLITTIHVVREGGARFSAVTY